MKSIEGQVDAARRPGELSTLLLLAAVQFVNILDFMMVSPLGPDLAAAFHTPESRIGLVVASYVGSAAIAGLLGAGFIDRFDRRAALAVCLAGLGIGTMCGALAQSFEQIIAARVLAGFFGGPATALSYAILADVVPPERRGRGMAIMMAAFSTSSVLGVPAGLRLAILGSWRTPFLVVGVLGLCAGLAARLLLPPLRIHLERGAGKPKTPYRALVRPVVLLSYSTTMLSNFGAMVLIPNISTYLQKNLGYPRDSLDVLYLWGGLAGFVAMQATGRAVDRYGSAPLTTMGTLVFVTIVYFGFVAPSASLSVALLFVFFMVAMTIRNVASTTLVSKVPAADERGRFMSVQSSVQNVSAFAGAALAPLFLWTMPGGKLGGIERVALLSMACAVLVPLLVLAVERRVRARA